MNFRHNLTNLGYLGYYFFRILMQRKSKTANVCQQFDPKQAAESLRI